jgi:1-acyl-sn-glycerol-3-phosphate acyltransferase
MTSGKASLLQKASGTVLAGLSRAVTGVQPIWAGATPNGRQRIYFANHASHGDFILVSTCLHPAERNRTAAVAAADYWNVGPIRRFIARKLLRTVLVERNWVERTTDPLQAMLTALDAGESLIFFPEGTRNMTEEPLLRFRSGLYNLAVARPDVELVPCWIENMSRVLPKGALLPVPLLCRVIFGEPITLHDGEDRKVFLPRAREALLALAPRNVGNH